MGSIHDDPELETLNLWSWPTQGSIQVFAVAEHLIS